MQVLPEQRVVVAPDQLVKVEIGRYFEGDLGLEVFDHFRSANALNNFIAKNTHCQQQHIDRARHHMHSRAHFVVDYLDEVNRTEQFAPFLFYFRLSGFRTQMHNCFTPKNRLISAVRTSDSNIRSRQQQRAGHRSTYSTLITQPTGTPVCC